MGVFKSLLKFLQNKPRNGQQERRREVRFSGSAHEDIQRRRVAARASDNTTFSKPAANFEKMSTAEIVKTINTRQDIQQLEDAEKNVEERIMQSDSDAEITRLERVLEKFSNAWEKIYDKEIGYTLEPECLRWNSSPDLLKIAGRCIFVEEYKRIKDKFSDIAHHFSPITLDEEDSECPIPKEVIRGCVQLQECNCSGSWRESRRR